MTRAYLGSTDISRTLGLLGDLRVSRLSRIFYSSLRAVRNAYLRAVRALWTPEDLYLDDNGGLHIEGYRLHFYQSEPDVLGGRGRDSRGNTYILRGGNVLERLRLIPIIDVLGRKIAVLIMDFRDEEHPNPLIDRIYRRFRKIAFNRTRDVEAIALEFTKKHLKISFLGICSGNKTFASRVGSHSSCIVRTEKTNNNIYTSNVWNHAMATWNTNPDMNQIKIKPKLTVGLT